MLCLSRKTDEEVIVTMPDGRTISVMVVEICGDKVRLGFTADADVIVHRREVQDAILAELPPVLSVGSGGRELHNDHGPR